MADPLYFFDKNHPNFDFSNFSLHGFELDGVYWPTVEHYFQAQKFPGSSQFESIRRASTPEEAKQLGQSRDHPLRPDWNQVKDQVMKRALQAKFSDPTLRNLLLGTGERPLVENAPDDPYWGCGPDGQGKNRSGSLLMEVREELRHSTSTGD